MVRYGAAVRTRSVAGWRNTDGSVFSAAVCDEFGSARDFQCGAVPLCVRSGGAAGIFAGVDSGRVEPERVEAAKIIRVQSEVILVKKLVPLEKDVFRE